MILAATGHRPDKLGGYGRPVRLRLTRLARQYLTDLRTEPEEVISGMALGWDQAVAAAALELGLPLVAAIPFAGQDERWSPVDRAEYRRLLQGASRVELVSPGGYSDVKFQIRNQWMVDNCHRMVALWNGTPGGTANCLRYAGEVRRTVDQVWDDWIRLLTREQALAK